jgi:hypothetical protein
VQTRLQDPRITSLSYTSTVDWRAFPSPRAPPVDSSASQQGMRGGVVVGFTQWRPRLTLKQAIGHETCQHRSHQHYRIVAAVSVAAYAQMGTAAPIDGQKTEGVVDAKGNLRDTSSTANPVAFTIFTINSPPRNGNLSPYCR